MRRRIFTRAFDQVEKNGPGGDGQGMPLGIPGCLGFTAICFFKVSLGSSPLSWPEIRCSSTPPSNGMHLLPRLCSSTSGLNRDSPESSQHRQARSYEKGRMELGVTPSSITAVLAVINETLPDLWPAFAKPAEPTREARPMPRHGAEPAATGSTAPLVAVPWPFCWLGRR